MSNFAATNITCTNLAVYGDGNPFLGENFDDIVDGQLLGFAVDEDSGAVTILPLDGGGAGGNVNQVTAGPSGNVVITPNIGNVVVELNEDIDISTLTVDTVTTGNLTCGNVPIPVALPTDIVAPNVALFTANSDGTSFAKLAGITNQIQITPPPPSAELGATPEMEIGFVQNVIMSEVNGEMPSLQVSNDAGDQAQVTPSLISVTDSSSLNGPTIIDGLEVKTQTLTVINDAGTNVYSLPTVDGSANQVLTTNGSGVLTWADNAGGDLTEVNNSDSNLVVTNGTGPIVTVNLAADIVVDSLQVNGTTPYTLPANPANNQVMQFSDINGLAWTTLAADGIQTVDNDGNITTNVSGTNLTVGLATSITLSAANPTILLQDDESNPTYSATLSAQAISLSESNQGSTPSNVLINNASITFTDEVGSTVISAAELKIPSITITDEAGTTNLYTLPTADGSANQVLTTNGSGVLTWADNAGGDLTEVNNSDLNLVITNGTGPIVTVNLATSVVVDSLQVNGTTPYTLPPNPANNQVMQFTTGGGLAWTTLAADGIQTVDNDGNITTDVSGTNLTVGLAPIISLTDDTASITVQDAAGQNTNVTPSSIRSQNIVISDATNLQLYQLPAVAPANNQILMCNAGTVEWTDFSDTGITSITSTDNNLNITVNAASAEIAVNPTFALVNNTASITVQNAGGQHSSVSPLQVKSQNIVVSDNLNAAVYQLPTAVGSNGQVLGVNAGQLQFIDNAADGVQTLTAADDTVDITGTAINPIIAVNPNLLIQSITAKEISGVDTNDNALFSLPIGGIPQDNKTYCISSAGVNGETQLVWTQVGAGSGAVDSLTNTDTNISLSASTGDITVNLSNAITITGDVTAHNLTVVGNNGNGYILPVELNRAANPAQCIAYIEGLEDLQFSQFVGEITNSDNNLLLVETEPTVDISLKDNVTIAGTFKATTAVQSNAISVLDGNDIVAYSLPSVTGDINDVLRFVDGTPNVQWSPETTYTCPDGTLTIGGTAPNKTISLAHNTLSNITFNAYLRDTTGNVTQLYTDSGKTVAKTFTASVTYGYDNIPWFKIDNPVIGKWYHDSGAGNFIALQLDATVATNLTIIGDISKSSVRLTDFGVAASPMFASTEMLMCASTYEEFTGALSLTMYAADSTGILQSSDDHWIGLNTTAGGNNISIFIYV